MPARPRRARSSRSRRGGGAASLLGQALGLFVRALVGVVAALLRTPPFERARQRWLKLSLLVLGPVLALNLAIAFFGQTSLFPLSPFHLGDKTRALGNYFAHRPRCLLLGHDDLPAIIARVEARRRLPRGLLAAVVQVESSGRVHRISPTGAMGPGQLMPGTAAQLGVGDPFDPEDALDGSGRYLGMQLARFGSARLALAAYNAGPGSITGGRVPRNGETEIYVARVLAAWGPNRCIDDGPADGPARSRSGKARTPARRRCR